ncbi:albumin-8-like [Rutidosis leptorrhynchoides]|uniref:albumin-8-like n=1 Tax=Rutidosis leptorrhynchoides TaxID=125765 RepID=UPI003A99F275
MAKFSVVAVLALIAIAAVAEASTVTVTTMEEENPAIHRSRSRTTGGGCSQQMMDPQMLTHCMMYLMTQQGQSGQGGMSRRSMMPTAQDHMELCCMELRTMMMGDETCMCETLDMMMRQGWMAQQMVGPQMMSMAKNLPMQCGLMNQPCQMQSGGY